MKSRHFETVFMALVVDADRVFARGLSMLCNLVQGSSTTTTKTALRLCTTSLLFPVLRKWP